MSSVVGSEVTRVLIAEDYPIVMHGLTQLLGEQEEFEVVGQATDGKELDKLLESTEAEILILDLFLKKDDGVDLLKQIKSQYPKLKVLIYSGCDEEVYSRRVLSAGAMGFVPKGGTFTELVEALQAIRQGECYLSPKLAALMVRNMKNGRTGSLNNQLSALTDRELQVFRMFGQGLSAKEIAAELGVSSKTIEAHREHIRHKLNVRDSFELMRLAILWADNPASTH